jgi:Smg protein
MMKENVLDVLMYLFENYLDDDEDDTSADRESLTVELEQAGFPKGEINKAFDWLENLAANPPETDTTLNRPDTFRAYAPVELERLGTECRGFIQYLENIGILEAAQREVVIDRIMALDGGEIDLEQVKWITLMVLFNRPGQENAYARMEDLVFDDSLGVMH